MSICLYKAFEKCNDRLLPISRDHQLEFSLLYSYCCCDLRFGCVSNDRTEIRFEPKGKTGRAKMPQMAEDNDANEADINLQEKAFFMN